MDITGMLAEDLVVALSSSDKQDALVELAGVLAGSANVSSKGELVRAILDREEIMSTGIGQEFAVPHAKIGSVKSFAVAIGTCAGGMEYGSLDKLPVRVIAMIAAPEGEQNTYLRVLKRVTEVLKVKSNRNRIVELVAEGQGSDVVDLFRT